MDFKLLSKYLKNTARSLTDIAKQFKLTEKETETELETYLESGIIVLTLDGYMLSKDCNIVLGKIVLRKSTFAYVTPVGAKDDKSSDIRVSGKSLEGFILGDLVYIRDDYELNGTIVGLYKRKEYLVGTVFKRTNKGYYLKAKEVEETNINIVIDEDLAKYDISDGDLVKCKIESYVIDEIKAKFEGVLVKADEVGADISSIIVSNDAPLTFPSEVLVEAKMLSQEVSEKELIGREDFRNHNIVTIDGDDALDFDDAVEIQPVTHGYLIGVHIADVGHYVRPTSFLDQEAEKRGTSIYVADRVVPMLPKELSNGICSLNPNVDRLVISCIMNVDESGNVFKSRIVPGIIRSHGRLTYNQVNNLFDNNDKGELNDETVDMLLLLKKATAKIRKRRDRNGALNLESTELKFVLDEKGQPTDVVKREQKTAEEMIEDLMIIANVEVAKLLEEKKIPCLFRVHDNPPTDKINSFKQFLKNINMTKDFPSKISSVNLSNWLENIKDKEMHEVISSFLLRSLAKAKYSPDNSGHFGLAEEDYLHFTSPIRRYPDLIVNRTLHTYVFEKQEVKYSAMYNRLVNLGMLTSACERRAVTIERAVDDLESCKYMSKHIGETFEGVVTSITKYGMYIELSNGIEGLMKLEDINPDFEYIYSDKHMDIQSIGKEDRDLFKLGTRLSVIIKDVSFEDKTINLFTTAGQAFEERYQIYKAKQEKENEQVRTRADYSRVCAYNRERFTSNEEKDARKERRKESRMSRFGDKKTSYSDRGSSSSRSYSRKPREGGYSSRGSEDRKPYERKSYGDRSSSYGDKKPYERKSYSDRGSSSSRSYSRKPREGGYSSRGSEDRKPYERKSYGDRSSSSSRDGAKKTYYNASGEKRGNYSRGSKSSSSVRGGRKYGGSK